jgi:hypothetical protein
LERPPAPGVARAPSVRAVETVNIVTEVTAETLDVDPDAPRRSIAKVAAKMGGVDGHRTIAWLDSGANVDMMSAGHFRCSGLQGQLIRGGARFNVADGTDCVGLGRVDAVVGFGQYLNVRTRFIVAEGFRYPILLGVGTLRAMAGVIDYSCDMFRFKLPQAESWRSLPLLEVNQVQGPPTELIYQAPVAQTLTAPVLNQLEAVSETGPVVAAVQSATRTLQPSADNDKEPPELWD